MSVYKESGMSVMAKPDNLDIGDSVCWSAGLTSILRAICWSAELTSIYCTICWSAELTSKLRSEYAGQPG